MTIPVFALSSTPRTLAIEPPLTDQEFQALCFHNHVEFERQKDGLIIMNPPTGGFTGNANAEITRQLVNWWYSIPYPNCCGRVFDLARVKRIP
jgi:Uma2 family endonuclease